jgi:hydrogenase expression/formation protein HypD
MKFVEEFRNRDLATKLLRRIEEGGAGDRDIALMEVCGTHTMSIQRYGLRALLPKRIRLLSGPGCPVCVTPNEKVDLAIAYAMSDGVILATFGDMAKVPGSSTSLLKAKAAGGALQIVYSTMDAVKLAEDHPEKKVVFFGIGFETTAPTIAASILEAERRGLSNYCVVSAAKVIPPAMEALLEGEVRIDGFLCPGHVSVIIGAQAYRRIVDEHGVPCVIAGFEPVDILQAIEMLALQIGDGRAEIENQYKRVVHEEGNAAARRILEEVFETADANWRGIGVIPGTGLRIREAYAKYDAEVALPVEAEETIENKRCICGLILKGVRQPPDCPLFGRKCTPENPVGACMVSGEGACAAYYKYR